MLHIVTVLLLSLPPVAQSTKIGVFVSAPVRDGFVDTSKEIQDSVNDVRHKLESVKDVQLVDNRDAADIVLIVVSRGVGSQSYGQRLQYREYYNNAVLENTPIVANTFWVATVMEVGTYRKELVGSYTQEYAQSLGAWTECASRIAKDLKSWAAANGEAVRQRRTKK